MNSQISNTLIKQLKEDYDAILNFLIKSGYEIPPMPEKSEAINETGESFTQAFSIQGILKYHGLINRENRIAYFPSISKHQQFLTVCFH